MTPAVFIGVTALHFLIQWVGRHGRFMDFEADGQRPIGPNC
jgi:hypothetical protein